MNSFVVQGSLPYEVLKQLSETDTYRTYKVVTPSIERPLVLKIGVSVASNGLLDREAYLLKRMREHAFDLEREYQAKYPGRYLHYQLAFPYLHESFVAQGQGGRRVLILEVEATEKLEDLTALSLIRTRDRVRVDHKTAAWILGKSLKILAFAHNFGVSFGTIGSDDVVISRDSHLVVFFDWTNAIWFSGGIVSKEVVQQEMYFIAREVSLVMGGDPITFELPESEDDPTQQFQLFMRKLAHFAFTTAGDAHKDFYQVVEAMWGRNFHPYTSIPLLNV